MPAVRSIRANTCVSESLHKERSRDSGANTGRPGYRGRGGCWIYRKYGQAPAFSDPLPAKIPSKFPTELMYFVLKVNVQDYTLCTEIRHRLAADAEPVINDFKANPTALTSAATVEFSWSVSGPWTSLSSDKTGLLLNLAWQQKGSDRYRLAPPELMCLPQPRGSKNPAARLLTFW